MYDIMNASLAEECTTSMSNECINYNYLADGTSFWTMTASPDNTYTTYKISKNVDQSRANTNGVYKFVYYVSNRVKFESGTGTELDPYIVK